MLSRVRTIEIPAAAAVDSTHTCVFPAQAKGLLFLWGGRSGGADAVGAASHRFGQGAWAPTGGSVDLSTASSDAVTTTASKAKMGSTNVVEVINGAGTLVGAASLSESWNGTEHTITLTVTTAFVDGITIDVMGLLGGTWATFSQVLSAAEDVVPTGLAERVGLVFLFARAPVSSGTAVADDSSSMFGAAAYNGGSPEQAVVWGGSNTGNTGTSTTARWARSGLVYGVEAAAVGSPIQTTGSITNWGTDGSITIARSGTSGTRVMGLAGTGIDARVQTFLTRADTSNITVTPGHQSGGGLVLSHCQVISTDATLQDHDQRSFGVFDAELVQKAHAISDRSGVNPTEVATAYQTGEVYARINVTDRTRGAAMALSAIGATTVTLNMTVAESDSTQRNAFLVSWADDAPLDPPDAVTDVEAEPLSATINIITSPADLAASGATTYDVHRSSTGAGSWVVRASGRAVVAGANSYQDGAAAGVVWYYRFQAHNAAGTTNSNVSDPVTTASFATVDITAPLAGASQLEGDPWSLQADTTGAVSFEWSSNVQGVLGTTEDLTGIILDGEDAAPQLHSLKLRVLNIYGDPTEKTVNVTSGIGGTGLIIVFTEETIMQRPYGRPASIPFRLYTTDWVDSPDHVFEEGQALRSLDGGATWANVSVLPVIRDDRYAWPASAAEMQNSVENEPVVFKAVVPGHQPTFVYIEPYGDSRALHDNGADASGTAAEGVAAGVREIDLTLVDGNMVPGDIKFSGDSDRPGASARIISITGTSPNFVATLAAPGLTAAVLDEEKWSLYGVPGQDKEDFGVDPEALPLISTDDVSQVLELAFTERALATAQALDDALSTLQADIATKAATGAAMTLDPAEHTAIRADVQAGLTDHGLTPDRVAALQKALVFGGGEGRWSMNQTTGVVTLFDDNEDAIGTILLTKSAAGVVTAAASG